jgi:hypothetical protein
MFKITAQKHHIQKQAGQKSYNYQRYAKKGYVKKSYNYQRYAKKGYAKKG